MTEKFLYNKYSDYLKNKYGEKVYKLPINQKKYNAKKYIAYFQNYTNTFMKLEDFRCYMIEAAENPDIVEISISTRKEEYFERVISFLEYLSPSIVVERLFSRVPEKDAVFSNWNTSWWKLRDELFLKMNELNVYQGKKFQYLNGSALSKL